MRVLDLTRVIAGPVATRTLGLLGADVLRIDPPLPAESDDAHADTGFGKRSALLDLADAGDRALFEGLLAEADVVVTGYRPGALERYGLGAQELLERRPGWRWRSCARGGGRGRGRGGGGSTHWCRRGTGWPRRTRTRPAGRPGCCLPRRWTTGRGTWRPRACCGRWPRGAGGP